MMSQNSKIAHIRLSWTSFEQIFSKIRETFLITNFKIEIGFSSNKKRDVTKIENFAYSFIVNFIWANFQQDQRNFFGHKNQQISNLKSNFLPIKKVTSQNSKIAHIHLSWNKSVPSFSNIKEPLNKPLLEGVFEQNQRSFFTTPPSLRRPSVTIKIEFSSNKKGDVKNLENAHIH